MSPGLSLPAKASSLISPQGPADRDGARLTVAVVAGRLSPAGHRAPGTGRRAARVRRFRGSQWLADWQGCGATPLPLAIGLCLGCEVYLLGRRALAALNSPKIPATETRSTP